MKKLRLLYSLVLFFSFHSAHADDYYWYGGSGDWTDLKHWGINSGGTLGNHGNVPKISDNVIFDANSFTGPNQTVTINNTAVCKDMTWTGVTNKPELTGASSLSIYGSLTLDPNMIVSVQNSISFKATTTGQTITTAGQKLYSIGFGGVGGGWTFQDDFNLSGGLNHDYGTLNTNNKKIQIEGGFTSFSNLTLGSSVITAEFCELGGSGINSGTSTIRLTGGFAPSFKGSGSVTINDLEFLDPNPNFTAQFSSSGCIFNKVSFAGDVIFSSSGCIFNKVSFAGDAIIDGSSSFQTLTLAAGKKYEFQAFTTQNVVNFNGSGSCNGYTEIFSSSPGAQATINKPNAGNITLDRVIMKDFKVTGGPGSFVANNSIDNGNNSGWVINSAIQGSRYWVGGAGNWSDTSHWSNTSGGAPGACVPSPADSVFFDNNSFSSTGQSVTIDIHASCNSMSWLGSGAFTPGFYANSDYTLSIYGELELASSMNCNVYCPIYFLSKLQNQKILTAGNNLKSQLYFNGSGGWWLFDPLSAGSLHINNGKFNTNNKDVTCGNFYSEDPFSSSRIIELGTSTITMTGDLEFDCTNLSFSAGTSLIRFTKGNSHLYVYLGAKPFYNVEFTNPSGPGSIYNEGGIFNNVSFAGDGDLSSNMSFNILSFSAGKMYNLQSLRTITVNTLNATGSCSAGYLKIYSGNPGSRAIIKQTAGSVTGDYFMLQDIEAKGGASFTANNSIDLGNNIGWNINSSSPRNLYWVGKGATSNWSDIMNWSTTSGGAGGACVPSFNDNVFFDLYSFTPMKDTVIMDGDAYCHDMDWNTATNSPVFTSIPSTYLNIYGSLRFISSMEIQYTSSTFFRSTQTGEKITLASNMFLRDIYFNGSGGEWTLQDNLTIKSGGLSLASGTLNTNNKVIVVDGFGSRGSNFRTLNLGSSLIIVKYNCNISGENKLTLNAGTSIIRMINPGAHLTFRTSAAANKLHNVEFLSWGILECDNSTFNNVIFYDDGRINGNIKYNKLTLSPGKSYVLEGGKTQYVDTLDARGNPCYPITIRSTDFGSQSIISQASGNVVCDHLDLEDQKATGGASFFAGKFSNNSGNNTGWNFDNAQGYIFGLGNDTAFQTCGSTITLNTLNFNATASTSYLWNDGSTADSLVVSTSGAYWVTADYGTGCKFTDSIKVTINPALIDLQVSPDVSICTGNLLTLTAAGATSYTWSPSQGLSTTTGSTVIANPTVTTTYSVTGVKGICTDLKMITVTVTSASSLSVTPVASVCQGLAATLTAAGAISYSWSPSDGLSATTGGSVIANPTITTIYQVIGDNPGCPSVASVTVNVGDNPTVTVSSQSDISCNGLNDGKASVNANGGSGGYSYEWSSNQTGNSLSNLSVGTYSATATDLNGCKGTATVSIAQPPPLTTTLTSHQDVLCNGTGAGSVTVSSGGGTGQHTYMWSNNETTASITGLSAATYSLVISDANNCTLIENVIITEPAPLTATLTITDASCGQNNGTANISDVSGGKVGYTYLWPSGGTGATENNLGAGIYTVTITDANSCILEKDASIIDNGSTISTSGTISICSGQSAMIHGVTQTIAGIYSQTFVAIGGCDSISDITLIVSNSINTSGTINICSGQSAVIHGINQTIAGIYSQTFVATGGCDSISDITLIVNNPTTNNITVGACNSYSLNGQTYNATGIYTQTLISAAGCDSIITLDLTINGTINTSDVLAICSGQSVMIHGISQNIAGIYSQTFVAIGGCDSISDVTLIVNNPTTNNITVGACSNYSLNGQTYNTTGIYTQTLINSAGCDSLITLDLTINGIINTSSTLTICSGQTAVIHGISQTTAGVYSQTFVATGGCDSISDITLVVSNNIITSGSISICSGQSAMIHGISQNTAGIYSQTFVANGGCDSISDVTLVVNNAINTSSTLTICSGQSAVIHGISQNAAGVYSQTFVANGGCDSISDITLVVKELPIVSFSSDIISGCIPVCVNFTNTTANTSTLQWDFGDGNTASSSSPKQCFTKAGSYNVMLTVTDNKGCSNTANTTSMITVHPHPIAEFSANPTETTIINPNIQFTNYSLGAITWEWNFDDASQISSDLDPYHIYSDTGTYHVQLVAMNEFGCRDSIIHNIRINPDYVFYVPNAITPNNDGLNDIFIPQNTGLRIEDYELAIYNRWGNLVFKTNDINEGWNARVKNSGDYLPQDTYVWTISTRDIFGVGHIYKGMVNLIR